MYMQNWCVQVESAWLLYWNDWSIGEYYTETFKSTLYLIMLPTYHDTWLNGYYIDHAMQFCKLQHWYSLLRNNLEWYKF